MTPTESMTTDQLRDWCAADDGWEVLEFTREPAHKFWWHAATATRREIDDPPYPPTRDGAAAALPDGWKWDMAFQYWSAYRTVDMKPGGYILDASTVVNVPDTGDEIGDRYRLAVLCRIAEKEATNGKA